MGLHDRRYWREDQGGPVSGPSILGAGIPRPTPVVKWLLVANIAAFLVQLLADQPVGAMPGWISMHFGVTVSAWWQPWRYFTFQFLHADWWHIVLNMLGVYILGTPLEQKFGGRRFLVFYLSCGVVAGLAFVIIGALSNLFPLIPIIGASGGVYGLMLAAAVYFPSIQIIFLFFPVPIRLACIIIFAIMIGVVLQSFAAHHTTAAMSDVAHLGGAVMAALWIWAIPRLGEAYQFRRLQHQEGAWKQKMARRRADQEEIDRILQKIHDAGLNSLTAKEKKTLQQASRQQQKEDHDISRL